METMTVGDRLRNLEVEQLDGTRAVIGRHPRMATIVFIPHDDCGPCRQLRETIEGRGEVIGWWGARLIATRDAQLRSTLGLSSDEAAVIVVDRFGVIWERHSAPSGDHWRLPDADAVQESAKFLGTQCPECGVLDRPYTGDWVSS